MTSVFTAVQGLLGLGAVATGYSLVEAQAFTTRRVDVPVLSHAQLRVLHLSDLHITPAQTRKIRWVSTLDALDPDLVVVTGDFLAHRLAVPAVVEALGGLLERPGLFVFGSNDYYAPEIKNPLRYFGPDRERRILGAEEGGNIQCDRACIAKQVPSGCDLWCEDYTACGSSRCRGDDIR